MASHEVSAAKTALVVPASYVDLLKQLNVEIARARQRAALSVNTGHIQLYGRIGRDILQRQQSQGRSAKVIVRLARDLKAAFLDRRCWSASNPKYMASLRSSALATCLVSSLLTH